MADKIIKSLKEITSGKEGVVVYTYQHPENLCINLKDGTGYTGNWKLGKKRRSEFERGGYTVITYVFDKAGNGRTLYEARIKEISSPERGRWRIHFENCKKVGYTDKNWPTFSGGQNPVRYFPKV